ncbi:hypothetical protein PVAP13_2KG343202 [Panicum virgatum]|uniref:Uncharacterized protein n=1 Tax=Panicum virgatum TaxID=38727 RepID=A0A8T0W2V4_PANVG|nr:hypothetical protein PVAP13_2KG343202 [Panicum virgatum]
MFGLLNGRSIRHPSTVRVIISVFLTSFHFSLPSLSTRVKASSSPSSTLPPHLRRQALSSSGGMQAAARTAREATETAADYIKQAAARAKDASAGATGTTAEYSKQAAAKARDAMLSTGEAATEYAKQAAAKGTGGTGSPSRSRPRRRRPSSSLHRPPSSH